MQRDRHRTGLVIPTLLLAAVLVGLLAPTRTAVAAGVVLAAAWGVDRRRGGRPVGHAGGGDRPRARQRGGRHGRRPARPGRGPRRIPVIDPPPDVWADARVVVRPSPIEGRGCSPPGPSRGRWCSARWPALTSAVLARMLAAAADDDDGGGYVDTVAVHDAHLLLPPGTARTSGTTAAIPACGSTGPTPSPPGGRSRRATSSRWTTGPARPATGSPWTAGAARPMPQPGHRRRLAPARAAQRCGRHWSRCCSPGSTDPPPRRCRIAPERSKPGCRA